MSVSLVGRTVRRTLASRTLIASALAVGLTLIPASAFAQHGGGGGGHAGGGGGGFHSGGGGFHSSAGSSGAHSSGGNYNRGGSLRGGTASHATSNPGAVSEAARGLGNEGGRFANVRPAIADGQWHSFGNTSASTAFAGRSNFVGIGRYPGGWGGGGIRGGWPVYGCCAGGWGWGFGFGYPYWALAWDPWWFSPYWYGPYGYGPYWYGPYSSFGYDPGYSYDWNDNPPPYRSAPGDSQSSQQSSPNPASDSDNSAATLSLSPVT